MHWIDTHCHMDHKQFASDRAAVLENAGKLGMAAMIVPAITLESNRTIRREPLLQRENVWFAVGVHPNHIEPDLTAGMLESFLDDRVVAIGETWVDFFRTRDPDLQEQQRKMFRLQIELALKRNLPLILHVRDAWDDALKILQSYHCKFSGVAHCFSGTWQQARAFMELGFALGIGGTITRNNPTLTEIVAKMPADMLLLETDAPYLAPVGCKGRNTPENIPVIAQRIAGIRHVGAEEIMSTTVENAIRIFGLK